MKYRIQALAMTLCSLVLFGFKHLHWDGVSLFLFGEKEFPKESDY